MIKKSEIKRIIEKKFNSKILRIRDFSKGFDHKVYLIKLPNMELVLRSPIRIKEKNKLSAQAWAFKKWLKLGVPVPKILFIGKNYLIEEKIEGRDLSSAKVDKRKKRQILFKLGKYAKKMHKVKTRGYGYLEKEGVGKKKSWKNFIEPDFLKTLSDIEKAKLISVSLARKTRVFYDKNKKILEIKKPRLLHCDLKSDNIMVKNGKFSGIIDASDAMSGDPAYDVAIVNQHFLRTGLINSFFKGYGNISSEKVNFYSVYYSAWLIAFNGLIYKNKKELKKAIKNLRYFLCKS